MQEKTIFIDSAKETERIAAAIGQNLKGGECIELVSDLGGGKTTFTRGLMSGMGSLDNVSSPTFTIGKQYAAGNLTCYHFDFYRLQEPGLVAEELSEALQDPKGIIVIEWGQTVSEVLPDDRIIVRIERVAENSEFRKITLIYPETFTDIFVGIA